MLFGRDRESRTEQELRAARPRAPHDLLDALSGAADPARATGGVRRGIARLGVLGSAIVAVAALGGIGFAASSAIDSASVKVEKVAAGSAKSVSVRNAASDEYGQGTIRTEDGPPELTVTGGTDEPVSGKSVKGTNAVTLTTSITPNESGTLSIQVIGADDKPVKINGALTTVAGEAVGEGLAVIHRYVVNTPRRLAISITIPASELTAGEELDIKLGYTDRDASRKRTVITIPAEAPDALPKLTRTFRLTQDDLTQIQEQAEDDGTYGVSFRVFVKGDNPTVTINWNGQTITGRNAGPFSFDIDEDRVDSTAVVTVTGGSIGVGDFKIVEAQPVIVDGKRCTITITSAVRSGGKVTVKGNTANCGEGKVSVRAKGKGKSKGKVFVETVNGAFTTSLRDLKARYTRVGAVLRTVRDNDNKLVRISSTRWADVTASTQPDDSESDDEG